MRDKFKWTRKSTHKLFTFLLFVRIGLDLSTPELTLWPITGAQCDVTVLAQSDWWNEQFLRCRPLCTFKIVLKWHAYGSVNFCHRKNSKPPLKRAKKTGSNKLYFNEICNYHVTREREKNSSKNGLVQRKGRKVRRALEESIFGRGDACVRLCFTWVVNKPF